MLNNKTVVGIDQENNKYLYHRVQGDGSCFVNCYLEACNERYRNELSDPRKTRIAKKLRLDFANFLISESKKTAEEISARLNILNPSIMANLIKFPNSDESPILALTEIGNFYDENTGNYDEIYTLILSYEFIDRQTGVKLLYDDIKKLYETDPRINIALSDHISTSYTEENNPGFYGYGRVPINIGYYEIATSITGDFETFKETIQIIISGGDLTNIESTLISKFIGINSYIFPLGLGYHNHYYMVDKVQGKPEILMVNRSNIHWDLVTFFSNNEESFLFLDLSESDKSNLMNNLVYLNNNSMI